MQPSLRNKCHITVDRLFLTPVQSQTIGSVNCILIHPKVLPLAAQRLSITKFLTLINIPATRGKDLNFLADVSQAIPLILILLVFRYNRRQQLHSKSVRCNSILLCIHLSFCHVRLNTRLFLIPLPPFRWRTRPYPLAYPLYNTGN